MTSQKRHRRRKPKPLLPHQRIVRMLHATVDLELYLAHDNDNSVRPRKRKS